jgi:hypothetical protein
MTAHKTVFDSDFTIVQEDEKYDYQNYLTEKLDNTSFPFNQKIINEIVLWKVNRYANIDNDTLKSLNDICPTSQKLDVEKTKIVLTKLIQKKGIRLPMASTILRFKNKYIYQIIDQRAYRIIYENKKLKLKKDSNDSNIEDNINLYIQYLNDLKIVCEKLEIPFEKSDRILYMADKRINKNIPLDNY